MIHGCTAQLVFALLISIAVFTSPAWGRPVPVAEEAVIRLRRLSPATVLLFYVQLVLGALVRHNYWLLGARVHLLSAFLVVAVTVWLLRELIQAAPRRSTYTWIGILGLLLFLQLGLGLESWLCKFQPASVSESLLQVTPISSPAGFIRSLHYVTGSLVFATTVIITLLLYRAAPGQTQSNELPEIREHAFEEVA
jgi:cytochrome c oxidase assembly protein subunit 15